MKPYPMPPDFPALATRPNHELADRYGVSKSKIAVWRKQLGVTVPCGAPKGNANSVGNQSRQKQTHGIDGPETIRVCLGCTRPTCSGQCPKVH